MHLGHKCVFIRQGGWGLLYLGLVYVRPGPTSRVALDSSGHDTQFELFLALMILGYFFLYQRGPGENEKGLYRAGLNTRNYLNER